MSDQETKPSRIWDSEDETVIAKPASSVPLGRALPRPLLSLPLPVEGTASTTAARVAQVHPFTAPEPEQDIEDALSSTDGEDGEQEADVPTLPPSEDEEDESAFPASFFEEDNEPFDLPNTEKLGIVGGKGVGKSYLFQAMVYRTYAGSHSGALSYYLDGTRLFRALRRQDKVRTVNLASFVERYSSWGRLPQTTLINQEWYRLRLHYRMGLLGRERAAMDVEFFDGSGEGFFQSQRTGENNRLWLEGYGDARVMVFCLPLWAAFPSAELSSNDWDERDEVLKGFHQVIQNYLDMRSQGKKTHPVKSILALTMADDKRSALKALYGKWILPYLDSPYTYLKTLQKGGGVARYLANARQISEALHEEIASSRDPRVSSIPNSLDFGGKPWLIPVSAIEGQQLTEMEIGSKKSERREAPVPAHVELPLLVALCERDNALM